MTRFKSGKPADTQKFSLALISKVMPGSGSISE
jgi:hypothetical protein